MTPVRSSIRTFSSVIGSVFHWEFGAINRPVLGQFPAGGIPAYWLLGRKLPARKLKLAVVAIAIFAGIQLIWRGPHTLLTNHTAGASKIAATTAPVRNPD